MPSADQSRCASSISLSDLLIHTALRRPCSQLSRMIAADWRPLPTPVPSPSMKPRRKRTAFGHPARGGDDIEGGVHRPRSGEMVGVRFAGIDDGLELGVGQEVVDVAGRRADSSAWAARPSHRGRLHQLGRDGLRAGDTDRLQSVFLIDALGQARAASAAVQSRCLVGEAALPSGSPSARSLERPWRRG